MVYSNTFQQLVNGLPFIFPANFPALIGWNQATDYDVNVHQVVQDKQEAVFGEVHYKVIPEVTLRAGLRYEYDSALFGTQQGGPFGSGSGPGLQTNYPLVLQGEANHPLIPKLGIDWQVDPDSLVYFTAGKGARTGGPNTVPSVVSPVCTSNLKALGLAEIPQTFGPDDVWSYEIGSKNRFFGNHLQIDGSVFLIDWEQIQQAVAIGCPTPFYDNLGSATIKGFDLSIIALPVTGLTLSANVGYVDAHSDKTIASGSLDLVRAGDALPNVLPWTTQVSAEYDLPITEEMIGYFRTDYDWLSAEPKGDPLVVGWDPVVQSNSSFAPNPADGTLNLRGGVRFDQTDVSLYILNALNDSPRLHYGFDQYLVHGSALKQEYERPLTVGFTATYRWSGSPPPSPVENYVAPAPAPTPPPAAPAPEAKRSFQVFFDFDKSNITAAAAKVIQAAADAVKAGHVVQITVTGHTDTVGSAAYNQGLSERRATAVKQSLVADGVAAGEISTLGVGKTGLLVPTADGVREPQNRRAEIVLQ
jgi:outer membrane protein OmpA-like peptidoglycan-associated protein